MRKEVLEARISEHAIDGIAVGDLLPLFADLPRDQVRGLLEELRSEERVHLCGEKRWTHGTPGPKLEDSGGGA